MIKNLLKGVGSALGVSLLANYRLLSIQLLRIEAAKSYLHGVRMARLSAIGLLLMGLVIGLVCVGAVLVHAGLFIVLPWTVKAKAVLGIVLGLLYVALGWVALHRAMKERTWIEKSGAAEMIEEATRPSTRG